MPLLTLLIYIIVVVIIGYLAIWVLRMLAPSHPAIIDNLIWVLVVVIVLFYLLSAIGVVGGGPTVPRVTR